MTEKIWCFSTPIRQAAEAHPKAYFQWMFAGEELFNRLESTHALFAGFSFRPNGPICFETFPHAIACALAGGIVPAKQKRTNRPNLLRQAGIDTAELTSIDSLDAALCALAAHHLAVGTFKAYGETVSGFIVVPALVR
jgi:hypothetical protein